MHLRITSGEVRIANENETPSTIHSGAAGRSKKPEQATDQQLIAGCRNGDNAAWEQLVVRYQRLIYTVPLRFGLSEEEAGDVFQETCLRLFAHLNSLRDPSRLGAWLVSTSRRLSLDQLNKRRPVQSLQSGPPIPEVQDPDAVPEDLLADLEDQLRIRRAVQQMDERCRTLIYRLFYDPAEPSYLEIATSLGMPKDSMGPIRARCFARLRALLAEESK